MQKTAIFFCLTWALAAVPMGLAAEEPPKTLKTQGQEIPFLGTVRSGISEALFRTPPQKVAVLPASAAEKIRMEYAKATDVDPLILFRTVFFGRFSVCPFQDLHVRKVDEVLGKAGLTDPKVLAEKSPQEIGQLLGVDALVYLEVEKAENISAGIHSYTGYEALARMVRSSDGEELWRAHLSFANRGGVVSFKSSQLGSLVEFEQENRNRKKAFRLAAEEWSRRVVQDLRSKMGEAKVIYED